MNAKALWLASALVVAGSGAALGNDEHEHSNTRTGTHESGTMSGGEKGTMSGSHTMQGWVVEDGGKLMLFSDKEKKLYQLSDQDKVREHLGHEVKITGSISGDSIQVSEVQHLREGPGAMKMKGHQHGKETGSSSSEKSEGSKY